MPTDSGQEKDKLLEEFEERSSQNDTNKKCTCCRHTHLQQAFILMLPSLVAGLLMMLLVWALRREPAPPSHRDIMIYSPGNELIEYETRTFSRSRGEGKSLYQGWPNSENDHLWEDASRAGLFTYIDEESAGQLLNQTERVAQKGYENQYMVVLDVFHQLHCLNVVRKAFYPERYGRGMYHTNGTLNYCNWLHIDHCIDQIRQSLMCSADVAPIPVQWNDATKSMRPRVDTIHTCRNFDRLKEWSLQRNLTDFHGAARVMEEGNGQFRIDDFLERKHTGQIEVEHSECNAI